MHIKILLTLTLLAAAKCSFSQDTTGGTRPNFVIPLHRSKIRSYDIKNNTGYTGDKTIMPATAPVNKNARKRSKRKLRGISPATPASGHR